MLIFFFNQQIFIDYLLFDQHCFVYLVCYHVWFLKKIICAYMLVYA